MPKYELACKELLEYRKNKLVSVDRDDLEDELDIEFYREWAEKSEVIPFYKGRYVLITGGTGFIGKVNSDRIWIFNFHSKALFF